jgi:hypothetical protein
VRRKRVLVRCWVRSIYSIILQNTCRRKTAVNSTDRLWRTNNVVGLPRFRLLVESWLERVRKQVRTVGLLDTHVSFSGAHDLHFLSFSRQCNWIEVNITQICRWQFSLTRLRVEQEYRTVVSARAQDCNVSGLISLTICLALNGLPTLKKAVEGCSDFVPSWANMHLSANRRRPICESPCRRFDVSANGCVGVSPCRRKGYRRTAVSAKWHVPT